jgi:hypothetical protein
MRKLATIALPAMLMGCTASDDNRLTFCDEGGREIDDVFLNLQTGEMVLNDVVLHGTLDCGQADLCFDPAERIFRFRSPEGPTAARDIEVPIEWGTHAWILSPTTERIKFQAADWTAISCKPVRLRPLS